MTHCTRIESPDTDVLDLATLLERFDGDAELAREIIALFLEDCPNRLAALRDGLARRDCKALERAAHSIKGSVANFAAVTAFRAASRVEILAQKADLTDIQTACADLEAEIGRLLPVLAALSMPPPFEVSAQSVH